MDWTTIITSLFAAILGGGGIGALFMRKETKKAKQVETEIALAGGMQSRIDSLENTLKQRDVQLDKKDQKIDELYAEIAELRRERDALTTENAVLKVYKCVKVDCQIRMPPFGTVTPDDFDFEKRHLRYEGNH